MVQMNICGNKLKVAAYERKENVETMPPRTSLAGCRNRIPVTVGMTFETLLHWTFGGPGQLIGQLEVERETC